MSIYKKHTDIDLIQLLKKGDELAFDEIYERYWQDAYAAAFKILHREEICVDVVQDIFVWLWENREKQQINVLKAYILTAVKFKLLNVIRNARLRDDVYARLPNVEIDPVGEEENLEVKELKEIIRQFNEDLPKQAKQIFYLSRYEFLSNKEIAQQLGISEKTVKNQLNISLKKLKNKLKADQWFVFFL